MPTEKGRPHHTGAVLSGSPSGLKGATSRGLTRNCPVQAGISRSLTDAAGRTQAGAGRTPEAGDGTTPGARRTGTAGAVCPGASLTGAGLTGAALTGTGTGAGGSGTPPAEGDTGASWICGGWTNSGRSPPWAQAVEREPANRQARRPGNRREDMGGSLTAPADRGLRTAGPTWASCPPPLLSMTVWGEQQEGNRPQKRTGRPPSLGRPVRNSHLGVPLGLRRWARLFSPRRAPEKPKCAQSRSRVLSAP